MVKNVGKTDMVIRLILGIGLLSLIFILDGGIRWIGLIGIIPLLTGLTHSCPLYSVLKIDTSDKS
ncbi:MAG: DUF2892 domain-containing protein [Chlorobi bacterium]|nr:DUF2892 domain-containing protein [Chlorobiota bacterium]